MHNLTHTITDPTNPKGEEYRGYLSVAEHVAADQEEPPPRLATKMCLGRFSIPGTPGVVIQSQALKQTPKSLTLNPKPTLKPNPKRLN